ncbi:MAG TPA: nucleotidyltransferase domain-containing protein [Jiangellaceae bacterium]
MAVLLPHPLSGLFADSRARVLDVLLAADGPLSGREIASRAEIAPTTANDALEALYEAGLAQVKPSGRSHLWSITEEHALVRMLREWTTDVDAEARRIVEQTLGEMPAALVVFGSTARADDRTGSDVDLLLIAADSAQRRKYRERAAAIARRLRLLLGRPVEVVVMDARELRDRSSDSFVSNVVSDGRLLAGQPLAELIA